MALIDLVNVSKVYDRASRPALEDINLHIDRGDFVFLVGASGAGKSTLLSLLLREEEISEGEIRVAGNDLRRISHRRVPHYRRGIGFVFQDYKLLENMTVWENVAFALEVIGTRRSTIKSIVPQVLEAVGLTGKEDRMPHELSGGEAQRVAIARAYANHPAIILADEPTGNLDPTTSVGIMEVLEAINRTGTTIVMATHNEEIVNSMRKRVIELHNGRIVRDEENGKYDSALYFPDEDVANKSRLEQAVKSVHEVTSVVQGADVAEGMVEHTVDLDKFRPPQEDSALTSQDELSESVARLARNVHSGRTGRYGEAFAPAEETLTWGTGLVPPVSAEDGEPHTPTDTAEQSAEGTSEVAPPAPPAPPAFLVSDSQKPAVQDNGEIGTPAEETAANEKKTSVKDGE
ncbi:cell division ATP-binding protein FtsE [Alloscardovia criceti]|uniref:cell division ATP-binding protein FtsE n=1 Tax=Alloscardovia criceti TaxID=356828 RepID=UPI00035F30E6|nr:cell division ATP-binding protein FtsE [Alloscardovia criceti]